jgi:hypothetical protein
MQAAHKSEIATLENSVRRNMVQTQFELRQVVVAALGACRLRDASSGRREARPRRLTRVRVAADRYFPSVEPALTQAAAGAIIFAVALDPHIVTLASQSQAALVGE